MRKEPGPWWRNAVIYEVYPRSFQDSNGDGIGDLAGLTSRLDYIRDLGADAVWLCPVFASPMKDFGYDVADYRAIDPLFGTMLDFDRLMTRADELGLRILLDMVLSHTSDRHAWFKQSRLPADTAYTDWYVWADPRPDGGPPNNWLSVFGGSAWQWEPARGQYYLHNWLKEQPDLNLHNACVQDRLLDECRFWLDKGVAGFRLDVVNFLCHDPALRDDPLKPEAQRNPAGNPYHNYFHIHSISQPQSLVFLDRLRSLTDSYGERLLIGEIFDSDNMVQVIDYTEPNGPLHTAYSFAIFERPMTAERLAAALNAFHTRHPRGDPAWAFENHDVGRMLSRWRPKNGQTAAPSPALAKALLLLLFSLDGILFLYQGQELGLPQPRIGPTDRKDPYGLAYEDESRDGSRTPFPWNSEQPHGGFSTAKPWLPMPPEHLALAAAEQQSDPASTLTLAGTLAALRRRHPVLRYGRYAGAKTDGDVIQIDRGLDNLRMVAVVNTGPTARTWRLSEAANRTQLIALSPAPRRYQDRLDLPPFSGAIWLNDERGEDGLK